MYFFLRTQVWRLLTEKSLHAFLFPPAAIESFYAAYPQAKNFDGASDADTIQVLQGLIEPTVKCMEVLHDYATGVELSVSANYFPILRGFLLAPPFV